MLIKAKELIGTALDWAVAKCEGVDLSGGITDDERYSSEWSQAGPIIEREHIEVYWVGNSARAAIRYNEKVETSAGLQVSSDVYVSYPGPTPLIAAMRCYVASKMGDEVEIPEEII